MRLCHHLIGCRAPERVGDISEGKRGMVSEFRRHDRLGDAARDARGHAQSTAAKPNRRARAFKGTRQPAGAESIILHGRGHRLQAPRDVIPGQ